MIFDIKRDFVKNQTQKKLNQKKRFRFYGKINKRKESCNI